MKIEISSDEEKYRRKAGGKSAVKDSKKCSESIKMKSRNDDSSKSSGKSRKYKEDNEEKEESTTEEMVDKTVSEESESESEKKRWIHWQVIKYTIKKRLKRDFGLFLTISNSNETYKIDYQTKITSRTQRLLHFRIIEM